MLFVCLEDVLKDKLLLDIYTVIMVDMFVVCKNDATTFCSKLTCLFFILTNLRRLWVQFKRNLGMTGFSVKQNNLIDTNNNFL